MLRTDSTAWDSPLVPERDRLLIQSASPTMLNALDPNLSPEEKEGLLRLQFRNVTLRDAIASGNATVNSTGNGSFWKLSTSRPIEAFKGLVMEAAFCRECADNPFTAGRRVFAWCTGRGAWQVTDKQISLQIPFITANKRLESNPLTARFYDPASPYDLHFYSINEKGNAELATEIGAGKGIIAGVQIKAIQGNERAEIIDKLISGRYRRVVTMLRHKNGEHSHEVCVRLLLQMHARGDIDGDQLADLLSRLSYPEFFGLSQQTIDSYSEWLNYAYMGLEVGEEDIFVMEAIGLEVASRLKSEASGIVMPDAPQIILPPTVH
ncbi:hypothetical protein [Pseudomonas sp. SG20052]|uniref:hypothetical protein n=1 Tax=Pseudomonas sp. SG20052 TaxID=3074147 RepID=UPI00287FD081|nr:hypothetical protein [Pseudomonas sp. SG20052]WNF53161.1 hypothetical protein RHP74_17515 [Pseudomonas sp. SG20052]